MQKRIRAYSLQKVMKRKLELVDHSAKMNNNRKIKSVVIGMHKMDGKQERKTLPGVA